MEVRFVALLSRKTSLFFVPEDMVMHNAGTLLQSLIPLVLIILFSWLFSLANSKGKKLAKGKGPAPRRITGSPIIDTLISVDEFEESPRLGAKIQGKELPLPSLSQQLEAWTPERFPGRTKISSKPITPKWWGA
jgi:hypothetical protein